MPAELRGSTAVVWSRHFGRQKAAQCECALLGEVLELLDCDHLVIGHTIQVAAPSSTTTTNVTTARVSRVLLSWGRAELRAVGIRKRASTPSAAGAPSASTSG
jgi:hypothetical protein